MKIKIEYRKILFESHAKCAFHSIVQVAVVFISIRILSVAYFTCPSSSVLFTASCFSYYLFIFLYLRFTRVRMYQQLEQAVVNLSSSVGIKVILKTITKVEI